MPSTRLARNAKKSSATRDHKQGNQPKKAARRLAFRAKLGRAVGNNGHVGLPAGIRVGKTTDKAEQEAHKAGEAANGRNPLAGDTSRTKLRRAAAPALPGGMGAFMGSGKSLSLEARSHFEPRFGQSFDQVRVHDDNTANETATRLNADAFTVGSSIGFAAGRYEPATSSGRKLLAHELAHVTQDAESTSAPVIRRFESTEHQDIGDRYLRELLAFLQTDDGAEWASNLGLSRDTLVADIGNDPQFRGRGIDRTQDIDPQTGRVVTRRLTPGQIIALMGDLYETTQDFVQAPQTEVQSLINVVERERSGATENSSIEFQEATAARAENDRYLSLAERNDTHFARENKAEWARLHAQALAIATRAAASNDQSLLQRALFIDASAGHFLTDSFAAGHLFDKGQVLSRIALYLQNNAAIARNPQMQTYLGIVGFSGRLPQLALKNIHDRMNREGFAARNARIGWRTFGDDHLARAQETQRIAALAVFLSRQQVYEAYRGGSPDPNAVAGLMPNDDTVVRATNQAIGYIPDAVREIEGLMYRNRVFSPILFGGFFGNIVELNLEEIGYPGRIDVLADELERAREIGVAPIPQLRIPIFGTSGANLGLQIHKDEGSGVIPGATFGGRF